MHFGRTWCCGWLRSPRVHSALVYMPLRYPSFTQADYKQNTHKSALDAIVILKGAQSSPYSLQGRILR